jgi:UPF0716 protein FxsA
VGLLFTIPFTRAPIAAALVKSFMKSGNVQGGFSFHQQGFNGNTSSGFTQNNDDGSVFDAEYEDRTNASKTNEETPAIDSKDDRKSEEPESISPSNTQSKKDTAQSDEEKNRPN